MKPERPLNILAPTRYPWRFNGPRVSRHRIENRPFLPLNKIDRRYEGVTFLQPWPPRRFDLVHAFNRLPLGATPYVIGFESHLPRAFWNEHTPYYRALVRSLAGDRCRAIIAISEIARRAFLETHSGSEHFDTLAAKLLMRLPNFQFTDQPDALAEDPLESVRMTFVGSHFARKGGCVAVRVAQLAAERKAPVHVQIVSNLIYGRRVWSDPVDPGFYEPYLKALDGPNITWRKSAPNHEVLELLRRSHFSLLPTVSDTFGYSVIESMAGFTPPIVTSQGALPEFVTDGVNGIVLEMPTTSGGEWIHMAARVRGDPNYTKLFADEVERLAELALSRALELVSSPAAYRQMRKQTRRSAEQLFNHVDAGRYWDNLYDTAVDPLA